MRTSLQAGLFATILCPLLHGVACTSSEPSDTEDAGIGSSSRSDTEQRRTDAGRQLTDAGSEGGRTGSEGGESDQGTPSPADGGHGSSTTSNDAAVGLSPQDADTNSIACGPCQAYTAATQTGSVSSSELDALSGLATSRSQPGIVFAHNDHDRAVVYALDLEGRLHARISLESAKATDLEDIALGRCGTDDCLYLADIGDNAAQRADYAILRFAEPTVPSAPGDLALSVAFERYRFTYEDGSHNAESLMVAADGTLYIITKLASGSGGRVAATGPSSVYRLANLSTTSVARATKVATLSVPADGDLAASAAAAQPCGRGFLLRTYDKIYEFLTPDGAEFEAAFRATPRAIAAPTEPQSEGIDYRTDGRGFITAGEGSRAPIFAATCNQ